MHYFFDTILNEHPKIFRDFLKFLINADVYYLYVTNLSNRQSYDLEGTYPFTKNCLCPEYLIQHAFLWERTEEGGGYWGKLDRSWREQLEHKNK